MTAVTILFHGCMNDFLYSQTYVNMLGVVLHEKE